MEKKYRSVTRANKRGHNVIGINGQEFRHPFNNRANTSKRYPKKKSAHSRLFTIKNFINAITSKLK